MFDLSLQQLLLRLVAIVLVSGLAGFLLALFARLLGDRGPSHDGRLTLNPLDHLDLLALVAGLAAQTGWVRPLAMDARETRGGALGIFLAVAAGLLATVLIAALLWSIRGTFLTVIPDASFANGFIIALRIFAEMAVGFAVLNILPLPPLAMGAVLGAVAPAAHAFLARYDLIVRIALVAILVSGALAGPFRAAVMPVRAMLGIG